MHWHSLLPECPLALPLACMPSWAILPPRACIAPWTSLGCCTPLSDSPLRHCTCPEATFGCGAWRRAFLTLSDTYVVMPIVVHEFVDCPVSDQEAEWPEELERRCCLFRMRVPPDQLNARVRMGVKIKHHISPPLQVFDGSFGVGERWHKPDWN